ncbi:MAG: hypothetical protein DMF75_17840 [Acidobacteria bacterium]|nr:MAG: hypothetical protein DMF75_17840 [Acidobacteriota bacterium]
MDNNPQKQQTQPANDAAKIEVSLVIPVRDEAASIEKLLASIAAQTRKPDELVIVDGGSKDGTLKILHEARVNNPKLRVIEASKASAGLGRNIGIANANRNPSSKSFVATSNLRPIPSSRNAHPLPTSRPRLRQPAEAYADLSSPRH